MQRDAIDFGRTSFPQLFVRLFIPTLTGLLFGSLLNVTDGIFVGRGVGSDALAAVNIVAPLFLLTTGVALMFASGVSIVAAIHLSKGNVKAANINVTQALTIPFVLIALLLSVVVLMPREVTILFGGSERLVPYVTDYLRCAAIGILMCVPLFVGMFVVRLDGSPNFAMMVNIINSLLNIGLDYLFVFPLEMGIKGAAIATSMASTVSALIMMGYFVFRSRQIRLFVPSSRIKPFA